MFRVDLRLRPDPASTQIAISTRPRSIYYESLGQNWERAAMIKARPCAGDRRRRRGLSRRAVAVHLAQISRLRRGRRRPCDEAADPRRARPWRDRGRGPQYQARPRRHPRDRILRADAAAHRRRTAAAIARPRDSADACTSCTRQGSISRRRGDELRAAYLYSAPARASSADDRRRADPASAGRGQRSRTLRQFLRLCDARRLFRRR